MHRRTIMAALLMGVLGATNALAQDRIYGTQWKMRAKPERESGLVKMKTSSYDVCTFRANGTFANGPIESGMWWRDAKGKFQASCSLEDVQRIVDDLYGAGVAHITSLRSSKYKVKEIPGKRDKPGKLKFSLKVRVHVNGDHHMDVRVSFRGLELP
ncbi:MAG: hypothetical protein H6834_12440 [Planctomycetes bacterium]|nr:hypothetical protein [Planctomycetota bacterium]